MRQARGARRAAPKAPARGAADPLDRRARVALALAMLAALLASFGGASNWRWGMNLLHYYPAWLGLIWTAAALAAVWLLREPPAPGNRWLDGLLRVPPALVAFCAAVVGALLFHLFRTENHLLGDGFEHIRRLLQGQPPAPRSALYNLLQPIFYNAFKSPDSLTQERAAGLLAIVAGTVAVGVATFHLLRITRRNAAAGLTAAALLLLNGTLQLFFGYIEAYPLLAAATLVFYAAALDRLGGGPLDSPIVATAALALGLASHPVAVTLVPGWLFLMSGRVDQAGFRLDRRLLLRWLVTGGALIVAAGLVFELKPEWRATGHPLRYLAPQEYLSTAVWTIRGIGHPRPWADRYRIWSLVHLADIWNTIWLVGAVPLALILSGLTHPAGRRTLRLPAGIFSLLCLPGILALRVFWRTPLGAMRDWDLFSGLGYGLGGMAAAMALSGAWRRLAGPITAACLFFLVPWIGIQIEMERAAQRYIDAIESEPKPEPAVAASYHCALGDRCSRLRQFDLAAAAYKRALLLDPRYEYAWRLGMVHLGARRYADCATAMERALEIQPDDVRAMTQLGEALTFLNQFDRATAVLDRALQLQPRAGGTLLRRMWVELARGRKDEARRWLARADSLAAPDDPARKELREWLDRAAVRDSAASPGPGGPDPGARPPAPRAAPAFPAHAGN